MPENLVISGTSQTVLAPATGKLTAEQMQMLGKSLADNGITFGGHPQRIEVNLAKDGSAVFRVTFFPQLNPTVTPDATTAGG